MRSNVGSRPGPRPCIAILDDEPEIAHIVTRTAQTCGYEPHVLRNGVELLALVEQNPPAVVAIDLVMLGMEGNEILLALRKSGAMPHVILMTGYGDAFLEPARRLAGEALVGVLRKPFRDAELRDLLLRALPSS